VEAAASITPPGRAARLLTELTSAHLLEEYLPGRFRMHDLVGRYAQERATQDDTEDGRRDSAGRILASYAAAAVAAAWVISQDQRSFPQISMPDPASAKDMTCAEALDWMGTERRNLVAAVRQAAQLGFDTVATTLAWALTEFFANRWLWHDWRETHLIAIGAASRAGDLHAEAWLRLSLFVAYHRLGRSEEGIADLRRTLAISLDPHLAGTAQANMAGIHLELGHIDEAIATARTAIELNERCGHRAELANAHGVLGDALQRSGQHAEAREHWRAALAGYEELGDTQAKEMEARLG
jgi:tetratricopeptide (TPR) repeat protein